MKKPLSAWERGSASQRMILRQASACWGG